jgi:hypothetical protein
MFRKIVAIYKVSPNSLWRVYIRYISSFFVIDNMAADDYAFFGIDLSYHVDSLAFAYKISDY